jgi:hypothetical protein
MTLPNSTRLTRPLTISPTRSLNSSYCRSRSASRTFCTITCLAVWAAMRPKSIGGSGRRGSRRPRARDCGAGRRSATPGSPRSRPRRPPAVAQQLDLAGLAVDLGADVVLVPVLGAAGLLDGLLHRLEHLVALDALVAGDGMSATCSSSRRCRVPPLLMATRTSSKPMPTIVGVTMSSIRRSRSVTRLALLDDMGGWEEAK